jgi:hypothetical protein
MRELAFEQLLAFLIDMFPGQTEQLLGIREDWHRETWPPISDEEYKQAKLVVEAYEGENKKEQER